MDIPTIPFLIALLLSAHGWRKKSLSPNGAVTALVVGLMMMAGGTRVFGVALIGFYLVGSRATKCEDSSHLDRGELRLIS
jgi:uncharacterized membrane protein